MKKERIVVKMFDKLTDAEKFNIISQFRKPEDIIDFEKKQSELMESKYGIKIKMDSLYKEMKKSSFILKIKKWIITKEYEKSIDKDEFYRKLYIKFSDAYRLMKISSRRRDMINKLNSIYGLRTAKESRDLLKKSNILLEDAKNEI